MHSDGKREYSQQTLCSTDVLKVLDIDLGGIAEDPALYFVVPGNDGPRWLIPAASSTAASALRAWHPYSMTSRIEWLAVRAAARAGILGLIPSVSSVTISQKSLQRWYKLSGVTSQAGEMIILVGNPSPDRKLIIFLLDDAHRIAAILKIGLTPRAELSVIREAEALRRLEQYCWSPNVLSVHPDLGAATQTYVHGTMPSRGFRPGYLNLLCHLPQSGGSLGLADAADALAKRLTPLAEEIHRIAPDLLSRCLSCLDLDSVVPTMLVHGDFAPWNIQSTSEFGYVLVDWECANFAGPPLFDLLHFLFSEDRLLGGKVGGYRAIRQLPICTEYLKRMDLDVELLPRLTLAYLLDQLKLSCEHRDAEKASYILRQLAAVVKSLRSPMSQVGEIQVLLASGKVDATHQRDLVRSSVASAVPARQIS